MSDSVSLSILLMTPAPNSFDASSSSFHDPLAVSVPPSPCDMFVTLPPAHSCPVPVTLLILLDAFPAKHPLLTSPNQSPSDHCLSHDFFVTLNHLMMPVLALPALLIIPVMFPPI